MSKLWVRQPSAMSNVMQALVVRGSGVFQPGRSPSVRHTTALISAGSAETEPARLNLQSACQVDAITVDGYAS
jgi:hypothetical protein